MATSELPDISDTESELSMHTEKRQSRNTRTGYSLSALITTSFLTLILATGMSLILLIVGKNTILVMVGAAAQEEKQRDKNALVIEEQKNQLIQLSQSLDDTNNQLATLSGYIEANTFDLNKVALRVTTIESFTSVLETKITEHQKAQQSHVAAKPKRTVQPKPKTTPIIPLVLMSIRSQSGTSLVALRDGFDTSDLLMPGDSWHGWTLLDADPSTKIARFKLAGKVQELRL